MLSSRLIRGLLGRIPKLDYFVREDVASTSNVHVKSKKGGSGSRLGGVPFADIIRNQHSDRMAILDRKLVEIEQARQTDMAAIRERNFRILEKFNTYGMESSRCRLIPVGSSVSGLCSNASDLDLALFPVNQSERTNFLRDFHRNPGFKAHFMAALAKVIERVVKEDGDEVVSCISLHSIRVPLLIIKLKYGGSIDIHFTDENFHAIRNSNLIKHYIQCDPRLSLLYFWIRSVCDSLEVRSSKDYLLSSYHLLLLTIHFLQCEKALSWPVLPVLCQSNPDLVGKRLSIKEVLNAMEGKASSKLEWTSLNKMPVSELAVRFIDYYSVFDFLNNAIFIDRGALCTRQQATGDYLLQIFDPYSNTSVCRSHYATQAFQDTIKFVKKRLKRGEFLDSYPDYTSSKAMFISETEGKRWARQLKQQAINTNDFEK